MRCIHHKLPKGCCILATTIIGTRICRDIADRKRAVRDCHRRQYKCYDSEAFEKFGDLTHRWFSFFLCGGLKAKLAFKRPIRWRPHSLGRLGKGRADVLSRERMHAERTNIGPPGTGIRVFESAGRPRWLSARAVGLPTAVARRIRSACRADEKKADSPAPVPLVAGSRTVFLSRIMVAFSVGLSSAERRLTHNPK